MLTSPIGALRRRWILLDTNSPPPATLVSQQVADIAVQFAPHSHASEHEVEERDGDHPDEEQHHREQQRDLQHAPRVEPPDLHAGAHGPLLERGPAWTRLCGPGRGWTGLRRVEPLGRRVRGARRRTGRSGSSLAYIRDGHPVRRQRSAPAPGPPGSGRCGPPVGRWPVSSRLSRESGAGAGATAGGRRPGLQRVRAPTPERAAARPAGRLPSRSGSDCSGTARPRAASGGASADSVARVAGGRGAGRRRRCRHGPGPAVRTGWRGTVPSAGARGHPARSVDSRLLLTGPDQASTSRRRLVGCAVRLVDNVLVGVARDR